MEVDEVKDILRKISKIKRELEEKADRDVASLWQEKPKIRELLKLLEDARKIKPDLTNIKCYKILARISEDFLNNRIRNIANFGKLLKKNLNRLILNLATLLQKERLKKWGEYKFSKIFPRTYEYLKEYIPVKDANFIGKKLPDVGVALCCSNPHMVQRLFSRNSFKGSIARFRSKKDIIEVDLINFTPFGRPPQNENEVLQIVRYMDFLPKFRVTLVHEYEHFLQYHRSWVSKIPFVGFAFYKVFLRKDMGMPWYAKEAALAYYGIPRRIRVPLGKFLDKFIPREMYKLALAGYTFNRQEIEARLAEFTLLVSLGKPEEYIQSYESSILSRTPQELERIIQVLREGIKEQNNILDELERNPNRDKREIEKIKKRIIKMNNYIWAFEQVIRYYPYLIEEAKRIGTDILRTRQRVLKDVK